MKISAMPARSHKKFSNAGSNNGGHEATVKGMPLASWLRQQ